MNRQHSPWIIAHRGARDQAPENTLSALRQALQYAIDGVEFDVQMSRDGVTVIFHDRTLQKVGGGRRRICDVTAVDLAGIDWGNWFHRRFAGEPLPTLDKALSLIDRCPNMCIEIKIHPGDHASGHADRLTEKTIARINQTDVRRYKDRILILSFDAEVLQKAHAMDPEPRYVLNLPEASPEKVFTAPTGHLWAVDVHISALTPSLVQWARKQSLRVLTYTCNGSRQVKKAIAANVDGIITDRPQWLARHLGRS